MDRDEVLFGALGAVLVGVTFALTLGFINGAMATAYSTIVLVVITGYYVVITQRLVDETVESRRQELAPRLELGYLETGLIIVNIGSGPALDIRFKCCLDSDVRVDVQLSHLKSGDFIRLNDQEKLNLITDENSSVRDDYNVLHLNGEYKHSFGDRIPLDKAIPLSKIGSETLTATTTTRQMGEAIHYLKAINMAVGSISGTIRGDNENGEEE